MKTVFFRLLKHDDKQASLMSAVEGLRKSEQKSEVFFVNPASFESMPGSTFAYWVSERVRQLFRELPAFECEGREARRGASTGDDGRRVRLFWEVPPHAIRAKRWVPLSKGGAYSPFYQDIHLVVGWDKSRQTFEGFYGRPGRMIERPEALGHFFRSGLTWSRRSQRGLSVRILPAGCIFSDKGPSAFSDRDALWLLLGVMNSDAFHQLTLLQMSFGSYEVGVIQRTPVPVAMDARIATIAREIVDRVRVPERSNECSHLFISPLLDSEKASIEDPMRQLDDITFQLYGVSEQDRSAMHQDNEPKVEVIEADEDPDPDSDDSGSMKSKRTISYYVGCAFGRWDIRFACGELNFPGMPDPFECLPVCSPGMLTNGDGLPATESPSEYPLHIHWDGVMVDDPDHPSDIVRSVREVVELIWKDRADAIEKEACEILGVKELRDYFRKPGKGGFWDDHITRYSKSRRKAPIYWLLQSAKKNYAVWQYCHRLDKDTLSKLLVFTVEPKVKNADRDLIDLRTRRATATGKDIKTLDSQIEKQDALVSELHDFEDKLRRVAELNLTPDLNDGVVLTIAPLRELVPWKEAKAYWDELMAGKYEWSSIGKQLREKGLVK